MKLGLSCTDQVVAKPRRYPLKWSIWSWSTSRWQRTTYPLEWSSRYPRKRWHCSQCKDSLEVEEGNRERVTVKWWDASNEKRLAWACENKAWASRMLYTRTKSQCRLKGTGGRAVIRKDKNLGTNPSPSILWKFMWAGISHCGHTNLCIFKGKMNASLFITILRESLVPFIRPVYPNGHCFLQDNDPKHCSKLAKAYYKKSGINWWPTPPESPDLNPIENLWHELKDYIWREVKPRSKEEVIHGIKPFWAAVTVAKWKKVHWTLKKGTPEVIKCDGAATGSWRNWHIKWTFYSELCCCMYY